MRLPSLGIIVVCVTIGIFGTALMSSPGPAIEETRYNVFFPHVPELMDANEYIVQDLDPRSKYYGQTQKWRFCKDVDKQDVPFDEGEMLLMLTFREYGSCKKALRWTFEKDPLNHFQVTRR